MLPSWRPNGPTARFVSAADLIDELSAAAIEGRLREATTTYHQGDVLIIDEIGYLHHADSAANVLYGVIDGRYHRKRSVLCTTNKPFHQWGEVSTTSSWPRPSSTASSSGGPTSGSAESPGGPGTSTTTMDRTCHRRRRRARRRVFSTAPRLSTPRGSLSLPGGAGVERRDQGCRKHGAQRLIHETHRSLHAEDD